MLTAVKKSPNIIVYIRLLIAVILFVAVFIISVVFWQFNKNIALYDVSINYHAASTKLIDDMRYEIQFVKLKFDQLLTRSLNRIGHIDQKVHLDPIAQQQIHKDIFQSIYLIQQSSNQLFSIQEKYQGSQFKILIDRLQIQLRTVVDLNNVDLNVIMIKGGFQDNQILDFNLTLNQLARLHESIHKELTIKAGKEEKDRIVILLGMLIIVLIIGGFVLKNLTSSISKILQSQRKTERRLLHEKDLINATLDSIVDAVITIDEKGMMLSCNKSAEILFGYEANELLGKNVNNLMPEPDASLHDGYLQRYLESGESHIIGISREVIAQKRNKETFPIRLSLAELPESKDSMRRFIGSCQDLTKIKQQEEQLRRSQKMDALGKLTGGIAHDYNNMLSIVMGYAEMLESKLTDQPKLAKSAHEILHAGQRGALLTKKLLAFSKQKISSAETINLNTLLYKQQHMLEKTLTARIKLVFDLQDDLWQVRLDPADLEDVVINMCINAMHAIDVNGQLIIRSRNERLNPVDAARLNLGSKGDYVVLSIIDTGCGMDEATKEKIFDPFFSTKGEQGTGLGLSQVYGFVNRNKGAIKVYSELNHGTQFQLYFPRHIASDDKDQYTQNNVADDFKGHETILLVDDEPSLLELSSEILSQQGFRILTANSAKQALEMLQKEHIDLLISDVIMPVMDGYQLVTIVQEKYPEVKIQLASGFSDDRHEDMVDKSLQQNMLFKPFNSEILLRRVRSLLDQDEPD